MKQISVADICFEPIGNHDASRTDLVLAVPGLIAECFGQQLHIRHDRILDRGARKRERSQPIDIGGTQIKVDL